MQKLKLGNSDLNVSRICLGCMGFGNSATGQHSWTVDEEQSRAIIKHALELGINFFDTAIVYQQGSSEQFVGRALKDFAKRDEVVVATKFLPRSQDEIDKGISGQQHIANSLDQSLKNLGMDYIDLYIYHMWDYQTPIEDVLEGLNNAVKAGKVRAIGIANCYAYQLVKANSIAEKNNFAKFVSVQNHYNLIFREEEREMTQLCAEDNIAMTPYSALASGRLSRRLGETTKRLQEDTYAMGKYDNSASQDQMIINRVTALAERYKVSMTEIAIAWLLTKVTAPIVGATKIEQVEAPVKAVDLKLSAEDINYLEKYYVPHKLVGVMAQNKPDSAKSGQVWMQNAPKV